MRDHDILSQIDDALRDHTVGPDAMRCNAAFTREKPDDEHLAKVRRVITHHAAAPVPINRCPDISTREHLAELRASTEIALLALARATRAAAGDARRYVLNRWTGAR